MGEEAVRANPEPDRHPSCTHEQPRASLGGGEDRAKTNRADALDVGGGGGGHGGRLSELAAQAGGETMA